MKTVVILVMAVGLIPSQSTSSSSAPMPQGLALGMYSAGSQWNKANPTLRLRLTMSTALDVTPSFRYRNFARSGLKYHTYTGVIEVGCVPTLRRGDRSVLGLRLAVDYAREEEHFAGDHWVASELGFSVGPDMEFSFPIFRGLTIGAHGVVRISQFWDEHDRGFKHGDTFVELLGQVLTIRYYF